MTLTTKQAIERLKITKRSLNKLVADGVLTPTNQRTEGAARWHMLFDSAAVRAFEKEHGKTLLLPLRAQKAARNGHGTPTPAGPGGISTALANVEARLSSIETGLGQVAANLDQLLRVWS